MQQKWKEEWKKKHTKTPQTPKALLVNVSECLRATYVLTLNMTVPKFLWSLSLLWAHRKKIFLVCLQNVYMSSLLPNTALPTCHAPATYGPKVGFLCFVDVVIQGGKVVARFHFVALTADHVGSTHALARLRGAAGKEQSGSACSPLIKEPHWTRLYICH